MLNLLVLKSLDMEKLAAFYAKLGLTFTRHRHGAGPEHFAAEQAGFVFEIYPRTATDTPTTSVRLGFRVDSATETVALLHEAGAKITRPPTASPWGLRAVIKDPEGHTVEIVSPNSECVPPPPA